MSKGRGRRNRNQREIRRETHAQRSPPIDRVPSTTSSSTPASTSAAVPQIPLQDIAGYTDFLYSYVPVGSLVVEHSDNFESRCKWTLPAAISTIRRRYIRCNEFRLGDFCCCILLNPNGTLQISLHLAVGRHDHTRWDKLFRFTLGFLRPPSDDLVFAQQFRARMHDSAPIYGNESFVIATDVADCTAIQVCARLMDETWETSPGTAGHNPGMCYTHLKWGLEASESRGFLIDRKDILSPIFELAKDLFCSVDLRRTMDGDLSAVVKTHMSPADCENCLVFGNIRMSSGDYEPLSGRASTGDSSDEIVVRLMEYTVFLNSDALIVGGKYELCCSLYHIKDKGRFKSFEGEGILGGTYKWRIKNLAQLKKLLKKNRGSRSVKSSTFCIGPYSCQLVLYPRGISEPNTVSVYLEISKSSDTNVHVSAKHLICLVNHKDENKSFTREIEAIHNPGAGWPAFCSSAQFFDPDVGFYREDEITFISKVQILLEESPLKADCHQEPEKVSEEANKLYIVLISLHGLIRGENMELGRDSDTGDQVKYVVELARALGASPGVHRVDLLTRKVTAPDVHWNYSVCAEKLSMQNDENDAQEHREGSGAYIIRIPFGPTNKYLEKEQLWPHISEFVDRALCHVSHISKVLGEQIGGGQPVWPAIIHGHYADAGDSAALLSGALNVPMLFTAHSLGRGKLEQLLKQGRISKEDIDSTYRVMRRIEGEELCLDASEMIITSTRQEIEEQWSLYDGFDLVRDLPRMIVISPGMEFHHIVPHDADPHADTEGQEESNATLDPPIWSEIMRFLTNKHKPMILALSRLEPIKNLTTLVKAYGECCSLREHANLILMMGNRKDIEGMSETNASVLTSILNLIDKYDLYGHVAYPKHHKLSDIPDIYRLAAKTKGVFINPAFIEPSGLTSIEAAACGLPIVATKNGGDVDIVKTLDNGLLIDPHDQQSIAEALLKLVGDKQVWERCRQNGLKNFCLYPSWTKHCEEYLSLIARCEPRQLNWNKTDTGDEESESDSPDLSMILKLSLEGDKTKISTSVEEAKADAGHQQFPAFRRREHIFVIAVDSDKTSDLLQIIKTLFQICSDQKNAGSNGFILSTALTISEVKSLFASADVSLAGFDAFICNSGSELYYPLTSTEGSSAEFPFVQDDTYHSHIEYRWGGEDLRKTLVEWSKEGKTEGGGQIIVEDESISSDRCYTFKVNDLASLPSNKELRKLLRNWAVRCHAIYCQNGTRVNVIPVLASRSQALRYLYLRWGTELTKFVVVVGEYGDTDYEGLLGGVHKTIVMKGVCHDSRKLHTNRNYPLDHVTPYDSTNMVKAEGCEAEALKAALGKLAILKA